MTSELVKPASKDTPASTDLPSCVITINGRKYDLTKWAPSHPGGPPIMIYDGRDGTEVFNAVHGEGAHKLLAKFPSTDAAVVPAKNDSDAVKTVNGGRKIDLEAITRDFIKLREDLEKDGLFDVSPFWFPLKFLSILAFIPAGIFFNLNGYITLGAFCIGMLWQQLGWISHELLHNSVYKDRRIGKLIAFLGGPILLGFCRHWWNDRHNAHHVATNIDGSDPDIDNLPFLAWSASDIKRSTPEQRKYLKYQHIYFWFVLPTLNVMWGLNSIFFIKDEMRKSRFNIYRQDFFAEMVGVCSHWVLLAILMFTTLPSVSAALWWFFIAKLVSGAFLAFVVFFNHYSCPKLDFDSDAGENFVVMQLVSTRNLTPGAFTDWFCGGLNYQVEHHLFPTMPRPHLYECSLRVRKFCKDHDLPYLCSDFIEGLGQVYTFLKDIADLA